MKQNTIRIYKKTFNDKSGIPIPERLACIMFMCLVVDPKHG